jgi:hypothetical protein
MAPFIGFACSSDTKTGHGEDDQPPAAKALALFVHVLIEFMC